MSDIEFIGYLAMITVAISLTPQVIKSWKTKSTKDISTTWTTLYVIGLSLWLIYGIGIWSLPLVFASIIEGLLYSVKNPLELVL